MLGKGYPDVATRQLIKLFNDLQPVIRILGFFDFDPHGVNILNVYRYGSQAKSYENHNLAIQNFHWIGLHYKDIKDYHIPDNILIEMTINDEKKCKDLLKNNNLPSSWRTELRKLSKLKKKAEIESLSHKDNNGLLDYFISRVNDERSWL
ncbi:9945_t:CDS:2 [Entrophospora sp. SA101]|nr:9945_t:CDS:2 [Entrophospora sp. SA101]